MSESFLFFGLTPPPSALRIMDELRTTFGLDRRYGQDRLHMTVRALGYRQVLGADAVAAACAAAASLDHPAFRVALDHIEYGVLRGSEPNRGVLGFDHALAAALNRFGLLARRRSPFRPHVTLDYTGPAGRHRIDVISWLVENFALIESFQGEGRHEVVAQWRLRPPA